MKMYSVIVFLVVAVGVKSFNSYCAERPMQDMPSMQLNFCLRAVNQLPAQQQTAEERLLRFEIAAVCYSSHYNLRHERSTDFDQMLATFHADPEMLAVSQKKLIDLLVNFRHSDVLQSQAGSPFNYINFLLDIIAPNLQMGGRLMSLLERMPLYTQGGLQATIFASHLGIAVPAILAYVLIRLVMGQADAQYIQLVREQLRAYQNRLTNTDERVRFDEQMRNMFSYFVSQLRALGVADISIDRINEEARLLAPERVNTNTARLVPNNARLARRSLDAAALASLTAQFSGLLN